MPAALRATLDRRRYLRGHSATQANSASYPRREANTGYGMVAVLCDWEGNRGSDVAATMHHGHCGISTDGLNGLKAEMSSPPRSLARSCRCIAQYEFISKFFLKLIFSEICKGLHGRRRGLLSRLLSHSLAQGRSHHSFVH